MACVFEGDERDSRAAGLSSCLAGSWKIPLTPEKLRVFLVLDLAGHCGRSDFYRAVHFCRPAGSKKLLNAATPSLVRDVSCLGVNPGVKEPIADARSTSDIRSRRPSPSCVSPFTVSHCSRSCSGFDRAAACHSASNCPHEIRDGPGRLRASDDPVVRYRETQNL